MDLNFNKTEDHNKLLLSQLKHNLSKLGGGEKELKNCMPKENDLRTHWRIFLI
jgi:hypothetical protein